MRVTDIELRRVVLPLKQPFRAAHGILRERPSLLVRATTDVGEGWGECPALPAPTYTAEYLAGAMEVIVEHLAPRLIGRDLEAGDVRALLAGTTGHQMAKAALELALLDAELRDSGRSLAARLGAVRPSVDCGASIGIADTVSELVTTVEALAGEGYRRIKLKIAPGWDAEPVRAVMGAVGGDVVVQVDANGSYLPGEMEPFKELDRLGLGLIEQPFPPDALLAHRELSRAMDTAVCLDESVISTNVVSDIVALKACDVLSVKAPHVGGYLEAVAIHDLAQGAGIPIWCGGMIETSVGRAANLALAALPGFTLAGDIAPSTRWFSADVAEPIEMQNGRMRVPTGPGTGIEVVADAVEELTFETRRIPS